MRKQILCLLSLILLLSGCAKEQPNQISAEKMQLYTAYYKSLLDNDRYFEKSEYYDIEVVMNQLPEGGYLWYVILDNPQIAMVDVEMLAADQAVDYLQGQTIAPSVGLFEKDEYSLIPNQVYKDQGYVRGLMASGECSTPTVDLLVMVSWKDYAKLKETREYFQLRGDFNNQNAAVTDPQASADPQTADPDAAD